MPASLGSYCPHHSCQHGSFSARPTALAIAGLLRRSHVVYGCRGPKFYLRRSLRRPRTWYPDTNESHRLTNNYYPLFDPTNLWAKAMANSAAHSGKRSRWPIIIVGGLLLFVLVSGGWWL